MARPKPVTIRLAPGQTSTTRLIGGSAVQINVTPAKRAPTSKRRTATASKPKS